MYALCAGAAFLCIMPGRMRKSEYPRQVYNEVKYIKYAPSASVGLSVFRSSGRCLKVWRIIFAAPGNWNEMSTWLSYWSGLAWSGGVWSGLFCSFSRHCRNPPMRTNLRLYRRLVDSLRIHSSLILVGFAFASCGLWTNGLGFVLLLWRRRRRLRAILSTQFTVLLTLSSTKWLMVECINYWWQPRQCGCVQHGTGLAIGQWVEAAGRKRAVSDVLVMRRSYFENCFSKWCAKIVVAVTVRQSCSSYLDMMWNVECLFIHKDFSNVSKFLLWKMRKDKYKSGNIHKYIFLCTVFWIYHFCIKL